MDRWYSFNFNISWDRNEEPKTWIDIFIIDAIVHEVISQKKSIIEFWRIHRRLADDEHGHELTLDCFTNEETASEIKSLINNSDYFKIIQNRNLLEKFEMIPADTDSKTAMINDTGWTEQLKEPWLYYIKGCCEMFLGLIENIRNGRNLPINIQDAEQFYTRVNNDLISIWQTFGCDSFFHHISAIFGYKPLHIRPQLWARF